MICGEVIRAAHSVQGMAVGTTMVDPELDELKREFLAEARDKVREMETQLDLERSSQALDRLTYLAHQLKGSGGSYGFQRISTDAAEVEKAVERMVKGDGAGSLEEKIQQHVVNLRAEIDKRYREMAALTS
jgi:HPt (histidine-containing phosphotransfer) domain-containing protein